MSFTVSQLAKLSNVSVRTLHHYDSIGLLKPSARSEAGYRFYGEKDLEKLQQILFYRELDLPLEEIGRIISDPEYDLLSSLYSQRQLLTEKVTRLRAILGAVEKQIHQRERKGDSMNEQEMFEVFGEFRPEEYEEEVTEKWGNTDAYKESKRRTAKYTKADWQEIKAEAEANTLALAALMEKGVAAESAQAIRLAEEARLHIDKWFYPCSKEMHQCLGEMYVEDARFRVAYDKVRPGLAEYLRDAIVANI